jgi:hypothetical protein
MWTEMRRTNDTSSARNSFWPNSYSNLSSIFSLSRALESSKNEKEIPEQTNKSHTSPRIKNQGKYWMIGSRDQMAVTARTHSWIRTNPNKLTSNYLTEGGNTEIQKYSNTQKNTEKYRKRHTKIKIK